MTAWQVVAAVLVGLLVVVGIALAIAKGNAAVDAAIAQAGLSGAPRWQADFTDNRTDDEVLDAIGDDDPELADFLERIDVKLTRGDL